ncbi:MAG: glycosyltransferase family 2 protein [Treponema sp.]
MTDCFFSIIIPVYNTEKYLNKAISSIAKQTFPKDKVELVIVNDASPNTDMCNKIIERWKEKLNINYIVLLENSGTHFARKTGVLAAKGKYLLHLDSDDFLERIALTALYNDIEKNGDVDYIEFNAYHVRYGFAKFREYNYKKLDKKGVFALITFQTNMCIWNKCFSTSFVKPIYQNMTDAYIVFGDDQYQLSLIEHYAKNRRLLPKSLYNYVKGVGICTVRNYNQKQIRMFILSYWNMNEELFAFFKKEGCPSYLPYIEECTQGSYVWILENSKETDDFISVASEILTKESLNRIFCDYIKKTKPTLDKLKKRDWFFSFFEKVFRNIRRQFRLNNGVN